MHYFLFGRRVLLDNCDVNLVSYIPTDQLRECALSMAKEYVSQGILLRLNGAINKITKLREMWFQKGKPVLYKIVHVQRLSCK